MAGRAETGAADRGKRGDACERASFRCRGGPGTHVYSPAPARDRPYGGNPSILRGAGHPIRCDNDAFRQSATGALRLSCCRSGYKGGFEVLRPHCGGGAHRGALRLRDDWSHEVGRDDGRSPSCGLCRPQGAGARRASLGGRRGRCRDGRGRDRCPGRGVPDARCGRGDGYARLFVGGLDSGILGDGSLR